MSNQPHDSQEVNTAVVAGGKQITGVDRVVNRLGRSDLDVFELGGLDRKWSNRIDAQDGMAVTFSVWRLRQAVANAS